jgi:hypothetical protein
MEVVKSDEASGFAAHRALLRIFLFLVMKLIMVGYMRRPLGKKGSWTSRLTMQSAVDTLKTQRKYRLLYRQAQGRAESP